MTATDLKKRAIALAEKTKIDSVTPEEVGQLSNDIVEYIENVEINGSSLGIRKTYTSVSAMEADSTAPKDDKGVLLRRGMMVNIYNQSDPDSADNGKVFSFQNPGWAFRGTVDAGYATKEELTKLDAKINQSEITTGIAKQSIYLKEGETICANILSRQDSSNIFINPFITGESYLPLKIGKNYFTAGKSGYVEFSNVENAKLKGYLYKVDSFFNNEIDAKYTQCDTITGNLSIDTLNKTLSIGKGFVLTLNGGYSAIRVNEQAINYEYDSGYKLYIVYLDKECILKCVDYNFFAENSDEIGNIGLVLCRFIISSDIFSLKSTCCDVVIDGIDYSINSNSKEIGNIKNNEKYLYGYNYITTDVIKEWISVFKVTKPIKVSENLSILNACSANINANACILYDGMFNIIGAIKGNRTVESLSGALYVDITYNDVKEATYIQVCEDGRNPVEYTNAQFIANELWSNNLCERLNENDYFVQSPGSGVQNKSYSNILVTKYDVFQKEVYAVRVNFGINTEDIDIIVFNSITKSYTKVQTIKKELIDTSDRYQVFFLDNPIYMRANMYIGLSKGVSWRTYPDNEINGSWILSADGTEWQNQKNVVFEYGVFARKVNKNFIGKTFSMMTDSIGTDNYATLPRRVYWKRLADISGMTNYTNSIKGGTCIMSGLRNESSIPFVDERRYSALKENGNTGKDPDIIIVQGGINDFGTTPEDGDVYVKYAEIGTTEDIGKSPETSFYAAYSFLMQKLTETYPNAQLVCCTPIKMWAFEGRLEKYYPLTNIHGLTLQQFVDAIIYVAGIYGAKIADFYNNFPSNEKSWENYHVDVYHPNDAGYAIMEEILLNALINK